MRKPILAGNWKMNKTRDEAIHFLLSVEPNLPKDGVEAVICAPAIILRDLVKRSEVIHVGAQNMNENVSGAYTGEISPVMLKDTKVEYVILGHSERRAYYNETDEKINLKIARALEYELKPIVCVGEVLAERENGTTNKVLKTQIEGAFKDIVISNPDNIVIAYEPVWAIGTGKSATSAQAEDACKYIRELLANLYGAEVSDKIRILYGGSVNTKNIDELMSMPNIDGGLVGGASLKEADFITLCKGCVK
ncbi:MAG: triose-phosphate isomerase [Acholeplasmatales bacterium]|nr:triose-phosphate isomerase [Acholeplasmatales bacterium]